MEFTQSLKKNHEFRRLYSKGKSSGNATLVVYCRKNRLGYNRFGITVSNKIGNAVVRNKIRRRLREIYRLTEPSLRRGWDIVVVARHRSREADYWQLSRAFKGNLKRLELFVKDSKKPMGGDSQ